MELEKQEQGEDSIGYEVFDATDPEDAFYTEDQSTGYQITNDQSLEWAMHVLAREYRGAHRLAELCAAEIERLTALQKKYIEDYENHSIFLKSRIIEYYRTLPDDVLHETKTLRKYKVLSGSIVERKPKLILDRDDDALIAYLKDSGKPEFVQVRESVKWADLKNTLTITENGAITAEGEIIEAIKVHQSDTEIDIEFTK